MSVFCCGPSLYWYRRLVFWRIFHLGGCVVSEMSFKTVIASCCTERIFLFGEGVPVLKVMRLANFALPWLAGC